MRSENLRVAAHRREIGTHRPHMYQGQCSLPMPGPYGTTAPCSRITFDSNYRTCHISSKWKLWKSRCVAWVSKYRNSFILFVSNTVRLWVTKSSFRCTNHSGYARECNRTFPHVGRWRNSRCKARTPLCPTKVPIQSPNHSCSIGFLSLHISRYLRRLREGER